VKHYARKWAEPGVPLDIRVTRSVEHAITFAFGTELHPNDVLRFTIRTGEDEYITLIATTLYVTRILCSTLPQSTDTSSAPSASSTCSIFSLDAKSLSAALTPRRSLRTTEMRLSPSTMSYAADRRGLTTALADLITAPTSTRTTHSGMRRTRARRRRSMRAMRSMPRLRPMRPRSSVFLVLCPTCHFDSMIYAHSHNILCLKPQRPALYALHTQHVIACPPPARPTCRVCKSPCLSNICSADAATAVVCLDVCLPCRPRWQSASSVLRLSLPPQRLPLRLVPPSRTLSCFVPQRLSWLQPLCLHHPEHCYPLRRHSCLSRPPHLPLRTRINLSPPSSLSLSGTSFASGPKQPRPLLPRPRLP
jgi:hypothetical protein